MAKKKKTVVRKKSAVSNKKKNTKKIVKKKATKKVAKKAAKKKPAKKSFTNFKQHITSLKAGDTAPFFVGHDQHGNQISLNDFTGKTLVLYFYPKDDTSGCTTQSCSLRDEYKYLTQENFTVVGVSADNVKSHKKFADKFSLPFPLLADVDMEAIKAYDVWGKKMLYGRVYDGIVRTTFIIRDGIIVRVIVDVDKEHHGKQVAEA
jgi:thioredoxin-dependent peroxiredoxin